MSRKGIRLTTQEVNERAKRFAKEMFGWDLHIPFEVSPRFKRTYGMCWTQKTPNGTIILTKLQIAAFLVNGDYSGEAIDDVIKHELIHWYTDVTENEHCKHNMKFKSNCEKFGVSPIAAEHIPKVGESIRKSKPRKRQTLKKVNIMKQYVMNVVQHY